MQRANRKSKALAQVVASAIEAEGGQIYDTGFLGSGKQFICFRVGTRTDRIGLAATPSPHPAATRNAVAAARRKVRALLTPNVGF